MTTTASLDRYERYGWHFDAICGTTFRPGEARFYADLARRGGGQALEPACGAARALATVYSAGIPCWGTDLSPAMLDLARRRLAAVHGLHADLARVPFHLQRQSLQELDLPERFGLVMLPLESFRLLREPDEQHEFLQRAAAHLTLGGRLAIDLTLPEARLPATSGPRRVDLPGGRSVTAEARWRRAGTDLIEETRVVESGPRGLVHDQIFEDAYRLVTSAELLALLERHRWEVETVSGDHLGTVYRPGDPSLVVVARRGTRTSAASR